MSVTVKNLLNNRFIKNTNWIIAGKVFQSVISLLVGMLISRYLGPSNYGDLNYISSFVTFFTAIASLGINGILVKELVDHKDRQGEIIGTTLLLRSVSSLLSCIVIVGLVAVLNNNDKMLITAAALYSIGLFFQCFDVFDYWYQSQLRSKVSAIISLAAYLCMAGYKVVLMLLDKDIRWFAFSTSLEYLVIAVLLFSCYVINKGQRLSKSKETGKRLLSSSWHFIVSDLMIVIYTQTDKIMLKSMMDSTSVGYYSAASMIATLWVFLLAAIVDSARPIIFQLHKENYELYEKRIIQLYSAIFWISLFAALCLNIVPKLVIRILYGDAYVDASPILRVLSLVPVFSYLGTARNIWLVCEEKQKYIKYLSFAGAAANVVLNIVFIKALGAVGVAVATLLTQFLTSFVIPLFIKDLRRNSYFILRSITCRDIMDSIKNH